MKREEIPTPITDRFNEMYAEFPAVIFNMIRLEKDRAELIEALTRMVSIAPNTFAKHGQDVIALLERIK